MEPVSSPTPRSRYWADLFDVEAGEAGTLHLAWFELHRLMYRVYADGRWGKTERVPTRDWKPGRSTYALQITVDSHGNPVVAMLADGLAFDDDILWVARRTEKGWRTREMLLPHEFALEESGGLRLMGSRRTGKLHVLIQPRLRAGGTSPLEAGVRPLLHSELNEERGLQLRLLAQDTREFQIDLAEDGDGRLHAVWVERDGITHELRHALVPPCGEGATSTQR